MSVSAATRCFDCFKWFPVLFILTVVAWSYYAFVVQLCIFNIESNVPKQVIYLVLYHVFLFLFLLSYYKTIFAKHPIIPREFSIPADDLIQLNSSNNDNEKKQILDNLGKNLPVLTRSHNGAIRYCEICSIIKPDRAHHCSHCRQCVLKMDHHCPWVNNCVGYSNYKFFVLFLFYAFIFCLFVAFTSLEYCIRIWTVGMTSVQSSSFHLMFLFIISIAFAFSVSMLFFYHLYLTSRNRSTLESYRAPLFNTIGADKNGFNLGWRENFKQVFGNNLFLAILPVNTSKNDGVTYESNLSTNGLSHELLINSSSNNDTSRGNHPFVTNDSKRLDYTNSDFAYPLNGNGNANLQRADKMRNGQTYADDSVINILD